MTVTITQLISYPIKSCAGTHHQQIEVDAMGLSGDRQMMLVDENGVFLSQRKHPKMALIKPLLNDQGMTVNAPGMNPLLIQLTTHSGNSQAVEIWRDTVNAEICNSATNQWFSDYLGLPVKLVKYGLQSHRAIDPDFAKSNETVAFADGYPLLIAHEATLQQFNQYLSEPIGMDRFRPNIVVSSDCAAWDELNWQQLADTDLHIDLLKPCTRCVMTGVEQKTGVLTGSEVLKTLKQHFAHQNKAVFGINGIAHNTQPSELFIGQKLTSSM